MAFHVPERSRITEGPLASASEAGQYGAFLVPSPEPGWTLALMADDGTHADVPESAGWEHVSVTAWRGTRPLTGRSRTPSWKEMAFVKDLCWDPEDSVVQFHSRRTQYVNLHPDCLHLWRSTTQPIPEPPASLIGPRP